MNKLLLAKIKELEEELEKIKQRDEKIIAILKKFSKNQEIKKVLSLLLSRTNKDKNFINGIISYSLFLEFIKGRGFLIIIKNSDDLKRKFIYSFLSKKFDSIFTIKDDLILGFLNEENYKKLKNISSIPYFNPQTEEFDEIELFKVFFYSTDFNLLHITKAIKIFKEIENRPYFSKKHFIVYSLDKNKIIDFEIEKAKEKKDKYEYIYEKTYPDLEIILKNNKDDLSFILALLERIDEEIEDIKNSKGLLNVVNRILNYIELQTKENEIRNIVKTIRNSLK